jgi:hypothetical protein
MRHPLSPSRRTLALAATLCALAALPGHAVEPAPATMVVSLVVPQSCVVNSGGSAALAPVVTCLHGEPWLVSQTQAPAAALAPPSRLRVAPDAIWTVVF